MMFQIDLSYFQGIAALASVWPLYVQALGIIGLARGKAKYD